MDRTPPTSSSPRNAAGFTTAVLTADTILLAALTLLIARWRSGEWFAPYGQAGDLPGSIGFAATFLWMNWVFQLYRQPPRGMALNWLARVGFAVTSAYGVLAIAGVLLDRYLVPRPTAGATLLFVPGAFVAIRRFAQLRFGGDSCRAGTVVGEDLKAWLPDLGWPIGRADAKSAERDTPPSVDKGHAGPNGISSVGEPLSIHVIHRLDQWTVLLIAAWAIPLAAVTTLSQKLRRRHLSHVRALNGTEVPTFETVPGGIFDRLGLRYLPSLWDVWCARISLIAPQTPQSVLAATRRVRRWPFIAGWLICLRLFGLGHATGDTTAHVLDGTMAVRSSWHPVITFMIFVPSYRLFGSPILVITTLVGTYWLALWLCCRAIERACGRNLTVLAILIAFNPVIFNYMGLLAKDSFAAAMLVLGIALLMNERLPGSRSWLLLLLAGGATFVAAMFNPTILPIVTPILVYLFLRALRHQHLARVLRAALACVLGVGVALSTIVTATVWEKHLNVTPGHKEQSIMLFDLTGMSVELNEDLLPPGFIPADREQEFLHDCYNPREWDSLAPFGGGCTWVLESDVARQVWLSGELSTTWKQQIRAHPAAYVKHRLRHLNAFLTSPGKIPTYYVWEIYPFEGSWKLEHNSIQDGYKEFYLSYGGSPLFRPVTWLISSAVLLGVFAVRRRRGESSTWGALPMVSCLASLLFYAAWTILGPAYDFRYNYAVIWLFFLSLLMLFSDMLLPKAAFQGEPGQPHAREDDVERSAAAT